MDGGYTWLAEKALRVSLLLASSSGSERIELRRWASAQAITKRWRAGLHAMFEAVNGGGPDTVVEQARVQAEERVLRELRKSGEKGLSASKLRVGTGMSVETCVDVLKGLLEAGVVQVVRANQKSMPVYALAAEG